MPELSPRAMSLKKLLEEHTALAAPELVHDAGDQTLICHACGHRCRIAPDHAGVCRMRFNHAGQLRVPRGYVAGLAIDPIEKKPFYHVLPGRAALSFGMLGCNFHCPFCQNWVSSQTLRDPHAIVEPSLATSQQIVDLALEHDCPVVTSTYNEPLITAEWAVEICTLAHNRGLYGAMVSNGHGTPEVLEYIRPCVQLFKTDLKSFRKGTYNRLGGALQHVLDTIRTAHEMGFWVEVVTLVVPELNDSDAELADIAGFIASASVDIPWHVTAFHPTYQLTDPPPTPVDRLLAAYDIGRRAGLRYVYPGNVAGGVGDRENTHCHNCNRILIERRGFRTHRVDLRAGKCPDCGTTIPGVWAPPTAVGE